MLLIAGTVNAFTLPWLRMAYFPFIASLTAFYGVKTVIVLSLLIPFLELSNFLNGENLFEEIAFLVALIANASISSLVITALRKKKNIVETSLKIIKEKAQNIDSETEIESFSDEEVLSHYLASVRKSDEEIKELLMVAKNAVFADSVHFFMSAGGDLGLRCSTEESGNIIPSTGGIINLCMKEKKPLIVSDIGEKKLEVGYLKRDKVSSLIAVPVIDGGFPLGVLTADSTRFHAFNDADNTTIQMFSKQLLRILQRERISPLIHRSHASLKILLEESSTLLSSLNIDVIAQRLTQGAYRLAPSAVVFFIAKGKEFEMIHQIGLPSLEKKLFSMKGTSLDILVKNKEPLYLSDVRDYRSPVMPFKTDTIGSVFALPLLYENKLIGILAILSEKKNAFNSHQTNLLEVLGIQASTSIANARFHEEIERLAITDGLTGLFNYRNFQERLLQEFSRFDRFSEPLSMLIIDLDYFKKINDTYGHPVGDTVLKGVADIIKTTIRNIDIPVRYGGEEFAVILIGTDANGAKNMAERLRQAVMNTSFSAGGNTFKVTISIGISTFPYHDVTSKEELIEKADQALYYAKREGRNRSILWDGVKG